MTKTIEIAFTKPQSLAGKIVVWRTYDRYSHSVVILGDRLFSSEIPYVKKRSVEGYPIAERHVFSVDERTYGEIETWLESRVGKRYDILSLLGWMVGIRWIQHSKFHFCHEFCREVLVRAGILAPTRDFITANNLILDIIRQANQR